MPAEVQFVAADGRRLGGTLHVPDGHARAAVVVNNALGVPHTFYRRFAAHLAGRGFAVLTYDYRGLGASCDRPLRDDPATLSDWARLDAPAAIEEARRRWPDLAIHGLGHSFGGQALGLHPRAAEFARIVVIGAGSGDLSLYPVIRRTGYRALLSMAPLAGALFGYAPGWFGLGADLPTGVPAEWSRWCHTRGYARAAVAPTYYAELTAPMLFLDLPSDTMAPPGPAAELRSWYTHAAVEHHTVTLGELPIVAHGHFGAFRAGGEPLWSRVAEFLGR